MSKPYLKSPQFAAELAKCLQCPSKPCAQACPVKCSPHDFIAAAKSGHITQAAELIAAQNPLGEVCGLICPDKFCMRACLRQHIDASIRIPLVQAEIMRQARNIASKQPSLIPFNGRKIAVIGLGPSGIGATSELLKHGFAVTIFEKQSSAGGALNLIPFSRLPRQVIAYEWQILAENPLIETHFDTIVENYSELLRQGFSAVIVTIGEQKTRTLGIEGENLAINYVEYLQNPQKYVTTGNIAIIGGGAAAVDCAVTAATGGAANVEMFVRRRLSDMRITKQERDLLLNNHIDITTMTRVTKIEKSANTLTAHTCKTTFNSEGKLTDIEQTEIARRGFSYVILALGSVRDKELSELPNIYYAGDYLTGSSTAVEALASGKKAAAEVIGRFASATK